MMYICSNCGYISAIKLGKCPQCNQFGTFIKEEKEFEQTKGKVLQQKQETKNIFYNLKLDELKRVFTNGIKKGGIYLLGGQPGIGKSTIVLQIINSIEDKINIAYFSGEEESSAIFSRYKRLFNKEINFPIFHTTKLEDILATIKDKKIDFFILDSIQTIYSEDIQQVAGSPAQVKYCSEKISEFCKKNNIAVIIIGHITKSGEIAGPKYLEHIVDVVAYLEGDRFGEYRFLRTYKNRFGPSDDIAIFQMTNKGLIPAYNFEDKIKSKNEAIPGIVLSVGIDNGRAVLTTIEVLVNKTKYKFPKRSSIGIDNSRLDMIIAILEKYLGINLGFYDIYINIPGEFKFQDSGLDLAIAIGILSAYYNKAIDYKNIFVGEISLSGKINKTKFHQKREKQAKDFNFVDRGKIKHIQEIKKFI